MALRTIVRQLNVTQVQGRIIILPSVNMPAVWADSRISTLDGVNSNRVLPRNPNGAPTAAIAGFLSDVVLALCDAGVDIHTGGPLATFVPLVFLCHSSDRSVFEASFALSEAFGAPWTYLVTGIADQGGMDQEAHRQGVLLLYRPN